MKTANYIVDFLIDRYVTDAFGIPGGVVLDLLYAMDARKGELAPHLSYHEQAAAFEALGFAQASGKPGVAYGTRGPGVTNMITAIADAYYDSVPLMVFTAHAASAENPAQMRVELNQEMDIIPMLRGITKYAARVERLEDVASQLHLAYERAMSERKGPVVLDILSSHFSKEIEKAPSQLQEESPRAQGEEGQDSVQEAAAEIEAELESARRPVILIGDGIRQAGAIKEFAQLASLARVPVLSSRAAADILAPSPLYYGFVGSHAVRCANFILSKADLIVTMGNRLAFPIQSKSFRPVFEKARTIRIDIDSAEFAREIPNSKCFCVDLKELLPRLNSLYTRSNPIDEPRSGWLRSCDKIRALLWDVDLEPHIAGIERFFASFNGLAAITCDVGNHSFWVSHAAAHSRLAAPVFYSNSFGALGSSLPKAIGAHYATRRPVLCVTGDQGFQYNIQDLELIAQSRLPIAVLVLNNTSSGMIRAREIEAGKDHLVHTTKESGFSCPDLKKIATAYGLPYKRLQEGEEIADLALPAIYELVVDIDAGMPSLPHGNEIWDLLPKIDESILIECENIAKDEE